MQRVNETLPKFGLFEAFRWLLEMRKKRSCYLKTAIANAVPGGKTAELRLWKNRIIIHYSYALSTDKLCRNPKEGVASFFMWTIYRYEQLGLEHKSRNNSIGFAESRSIRAIDTRTTQQAHEEFH